MSAFSSFGGKVAVVTGGASGIGRGISEALIAEGMQVVIADIEEGALQRTAGEIGAVGVRTDVSDFGSMHALAATVRERFGTAHIVCNNAGVGSLGTIADVTIDDWRWVMGVNLWGVIYGVTTFLPMLKSNPDGGHIINTASAGGFGTMPGFGPYCVTKHGVVALTETLAQELELVKSKVGASILCPGTVRTNIKSSLRNRPSGLGQAHLRDVDLENEEFGRQARWLEPREVGAAVVESIRRGDLYVITHPEMLPPIEARLRGIIGAFKGAGS